MVLLHILPKQHFELTINEYGDVFEGSKHLGELNLYCENDTFLTGPTGPTGPTAPGPLGSRGIMGNVGFTGDQGTSFTGPVGPTGIDGVPGMIGPLGIKGRQGPHGPIGCIGDPGPIRYSNPKPYLSATIKKPFIYNNDTYPILPWDTIINNNFTLNNKVIKFPLKYGLYKIEVGFQIRECTLDVIGIELVFNNKCKKYTHLVPNSKRAFQRHSSCNSLHVIHPVELETTLEIQFSCIGNVWFENGYISIIELT